MQALVTIGWQDLAEQAADWLERNVLLPSLLAQAICITVLLLLTWWIGPRLQRLAPNLAAHDAAGPLHRIVVALARVAGWISLLLLLWFARAWCWPGC